MWRPEGWDEIVEKSGWDGEGLSGFEEGADAMLEALKKESLLYVDKLAQGSTILHDKPRQGWLIFIPDEVQG